MQSDASKMAFAGMLTAVAVVIMSLGSLIPVNTYVCPVLCILIIRLVIDRCGRKMAWCGYLATAILSLLLAPDREAALVYLCMGYYPLIRHWFQRIPVKALAMVAKVLYFSAAGALSYGILMLLMGVEAVLGELQGGGGWLLAVTVVMWDVLFLLVDRLLDVDFSRRRKTK